MVQPDERVRWTILFSGTVQGVGFRWTTRQVAERFQVSGYVRNLPDGRVEVTAEASRGELQRFHNAIEDALAGYIRDRQRTERPGTDEFADFGIRF